ncbi:MAG: uracil-DNA glycosylase family protein [Thermoleophilaceae bacterium]
MAINQNEYGGLGAHWWIVIGALAKLDRGAEPTFHYSVGRYMAAVLATLDGMPVPPEDELDAAASVEAWRRCCFTEAIKCSPLGDDSRPSQAMWQNCPVRFLLAELEILQPRTLIVVGRGTGDALRRLLIWKGPEYGPSFSRATALLGSTQVEGFFLNHPAYGHWRSSLESLLASLRTRPPVHVSD